MPSGEITSVDFHGSSATIKDEEGNVREFNFRDIKGGWRGERPGELKKFGPKGLVVGCKAYFHVDGENKISLVEPSPLSS